MLLGDIIALNAPGAPDRAALIDGDREVTFGRPPRATPPGSPTPCSAWPRPGDRIAILAENIAEYVECYYGVPAAGMALTFLNYRLHPKEWAWILDNAERVVLLVERDFLEQIEPVLAEVPVDPARHRRSAASGDDGLVSTTTTSSARRPTTAPPVDVDEDDTAWLIYTSGTTGFPKGAMLTHRNLVTAVVESVIEYQPQPDERNLLAFPLCHVAGLHRAAHPPARRPRGADAGLRARAVHAARRRATASPARPGADDAELPPAAPEDRRVRPVDPARHRLRRGGDAGRGAEARRSSASAPSCTPGSG